MIKVPAHHTSQTCISCGHISPENRKTQDLFCCTNCGHTAHADVHAAQEIRRRGIEVLIAEGLSVSACGELCVSTSVKQEETPALPRVRSENQNRPQRAAWKGNQKPRTLVRGEVTDHWTRDDFWSRCAAPLSNHVKIDHFFLDAVYGVVRCGYEGASSPASPCAMRRTVA
jgi:predicted RNA-binding Zn-ribbon protein involved in translation (DUF1610 family)